MNICSHTCANPISEMIKQKRAKNNRRVFIFIRVRRSYLFGLETSVYIYIRAPRGMGWDGMEWDCPIPRGALIYILIQREK
jgi:hypothetical protein